MSSISRADDQLEFRILGPVEARLCSDSVTLTGKQRSLLAVMLLAANRVVAVDQLAEAVWGPRLPAAHQTRVRALVSELRKAFAFTGADLIVTQQPGYLLRIQRGQLDLDVFKLGVEQARAAAAGGEPEVVVAHYDEALRSWRGAPLGGVSGPFVDTYAAGLEELRLRVVEERAEAMLACGRHAEMVTELRQVIAAQPLRERPYGQLMVALYRAGRRGEALGVYRELRELLVEQLGLEPAADLQLLQRQVLAGDPALRQTPASALSPMRRASSPTRQLPADSGRFVGRRAELDQLDMLALGPDRLVLVVGTAGTGKTTLVVRWAHGAAARFPDGQLFVNMRGFQRGSRMSAAAALTQLLQALGVPAEEIPISQDAQAALYRSTLAGRRFLIVLDNVAEPGQVRPLLPGEPGCLALVTSRDRLGGLVALDGARRLTLDVFAPADALAVLAQTAGADLVDADRDAAAELARLCGHLPLALRIAAGRLADQPRLTIRHHVQELAARGRMAQLRMAGDEQADLRDAFDLSYQVLAPATQRLFRLLGLVPAPAGWSTGAAAALAAVTVTEVEHLLDALARLHLVKVVAADRYEFHDLLLEYAGDLAVAHDPPSQRDAAVHRLLDFYLHTTDHAATLTFSPTSALPRDPLTPGVAPLAFMDAAHARDWMIAEWANIVAAQRYAAAYGPRSMAWQLTDALRSHLYLTVTGQQWLAIAETGLTAARGENDALGEAASRFCLGLLRSQMAEYASAVQQHGLAAKLYRQARWKRGESAALRGMGVPLAHLGQTRLALEMFHQSLVIDRDIGNQHGEAANLNNIASAHAELGEPREAARHLAVAIPLLRSLGRSHGEAIALISQSELSHKQGRLDEALITLEQSLAICRERGYRHEEAEALTIMGQVQRDAGRYSEATAVFLAGLHLAEHHHHLFVEVLALNGLATVDIMLGRAADAIARLNIVLAAASRTGHHRSHVDALITLCYAACAQAQHQTAHQHATQALALARETRSTSETARVNTALAAACLGLGDLVQSLNHAQRALEAQQRAGERLAQTRTLRILARAHQLAGHDHDAEASRRQAIALADEIGTPYWRIRGMG